jgi:hypothetical protein
MGAAWPGDLSNKEAQMAKIKNCQNCEHSHTGHLDRGANWMSCAKGHRLVADEELVHEHHLYYDPQEKVVRLTREGWAMGKGTGEPMLNRTDCPDWKRRRFRLDLGNPEYD